MMKPTGPGGYAAGCAGSQLQPRRRAYSHVVNRSGQVISFQLFTFPQGPFMPLQSDFFEQPFSNLVSEEWVRQDLIGPDR